LRLVASQRHDAVPPHGSFWNLTRSPVRVAKSSSWPPGFRAVLNTVRQSGVFARGAVLLVLLVVLVLVDMLRCSCRVSE
jgi:hypothetical protein